MPDELNAAPAPAPAGDNGGAPPAKDGAKTLFLSADMLPPGKKVNPGDKLTFSVVKADGGDIEAVYDEGSGEPEMEEKDAFARDFKDSMSARNAAQPEEGI
jgi:hypothetical protein